MAKTIREKFELGLLDDLYSSYIMDHCAGDRMICNGQDLTVAVEDGYLFEEFIAWMEVQYSASFEKFISDMEAQRESDESDL